MVLYRVLARLGEGGTGNVYRAVQESIEKKVALEVLKIGYSSSSEMVVRFHREAVSGSARPQALPPAPTNLPQLGRCYETVAGERREVPGQ